MLLSISAALAALAMATHDGVGAGEHKLIFPNASDGRQVLAIDLHTHSVFSDGTVWPTVRVEEARRDGLALMAVTEHLEYQPHGKDIPHPDRNRSFEIAHGDVEEGDILIVNGAEVTRNLPVGHINAVFIEDANPLLTLRQDEPRFEITAARNAESAGEALKEAKRQGGFVFMNHPAWTGQRKDGVMQPTAFHNEIAQNGLLDGIEVANGFLYSDEAFTFALENDLAILGVSDIHGLIAWDYETPNNAIVPGAKGHRTVSLVLAEERSVEGVREALDARAAVALMQNTLYGRPEHLAPIVMGSVSLTLGEPGSNWEGATNVFDMTIANTAPIPFTLTSIGDQGYYGHSKTFTVPAMSEIDVKLTAVADAKNLKALTFRLLNVYEAPGQNLVVELPVGR